MSSEIIFYLTFLALAVIAVIYCTYKRVQEIIEGRRLRYRVKVTSGPIAGTDQTEYHAWIEQWNYDDDEWFRQMFGDVDGTGYREIYHWYALTREEAVAPAMQRITELRANDQFLTETATRRESADKRAKVLYHE